MKKNRTFKQGRGSEQLLNQEMYDIFTAVKDINPDITEQEKIVGSKAVPDNTIHGALWRKDRTNELKYYDGVKKEWVNVFDNKFQLITHLTEETTPVNPIKGQLWIYNGIMMYFDGREWKPIKSIPANDAQFNEAAFADFALVSPLLSVGNVTVPSIETKDSERYNKKLKADTENNDAVKNSDTYNVNWEDPFTAPQKNFSIDPNHRTQYVIPSVVNDRIFIENNLVNDYEKVNSVCFQYPTIKAQGKNFSALHINAQKLSNITKRLFKINKDDSNTNAIINIDPNNTEFYGFRAGENKGDHLYPYYEKVDTGITNSTARSVSSTSGIPQIDDINAQLNPDINYKKPDKITVDNKSVREDRSIKDDPDNRFGDYVILHKKISLNYRTVQNYDYILAVTYDFNWINYTGSLKKLNNGNLFEGFHVPSLPESLNLFFDGLMLEEKFYDVDLKNQLVKLEDKIYKEDEVHVFKNFVKDSGYIVETNLDNMGIISLHKKFKSPLVFVAGELIHPVFGGLIFRDDKIFVPRAKVNMPWTVIETFIPGEENSYAAGTVAFDSNIIGGTNRTLNKIDDNLDATAVYDRGEQSLIIQQGQINHSGNNSIYYDPAVIKNTDEIILFLDGMLINPKNIIWNKGYHYLTLKDGLFPGRQNLLLRDPDDRLFDNATTMGTYYTGALSDSLVYQNGKLLCNQQPLISPVSPAERQSKTADGEVVLFMPDDVSDSATVQIYDDYKKEWRLTTDKELREVKSICTSYENTVSSIKMNAPVLPEDSIDIFAYKFAGDSENAIKIGDFIRDTSDTTNRSYHMEYDKYSPRVNSLTVFRNGVRQILDIDYIENEDGRSIKFINGPDEIKINERIHYTIEQIETGASKVMDVITLDNKNAIGTNVYEIPKQTELYLYPGRLVVYRNGVRLPKEDWTLIGNKTIQIINSDRPYIGTTSNYPKESFFNKNTDTTYVINHHQPDRITIEIRQDYKRKEHTFKMRYNRIPEFPINDYGIDPQVLESKDEVLFYINGLFTGLSRNIVNGYILNKYKSCITFTDRQVATLLANDPLYIDLFENPGKMEAWKKRTGKSEYTTSIKHYITYDYRI